MTENLFVVLQYISIPRISFKWVYFHHCQKLSHVVYIPRWNKNIDKNYFLILQLFKTNFKLQKNLDTFMSKTHEHSFFSNWAQILRYEYFDLEYNLEKWTARKQNIFFKNIWNNMCIIRLMGLRIEKFEYKIWSKFAFCTH